jgi:hypothetical protein
VHTREEDSAHEEGNVLQRRALSRELLLDLVVKLHPRQHPLAAGRLRLSQSLRGAILAATAAVCLLGEDAASVAVCLVGEEEEAAETV